MQVRFACGTSWEHMQGDGCRRFCADCRREVFDFAQLRPDEIRDRMQASRGSLCARLTWQDGRLVVAGEPEAPASLAPRGARRAPALAAGLVTAWLSASAGAAQPETPAATAAAPGTVATAAAPGTVASAAAAGAVATAAAPGTAVTPAAPAAPPAAVAGSAGAPAARDDAARARRVAPAGGAVLRGSVTLEGQPLAGVHIVATNLFDGRETLASTGEDGIFHIASLRAGIYEITGRSDGFTIASQTVVLQAGGQGQPNLAAEAGILVTAGILVGEEAPLRRAYDLSELVAAAVVGPSTVASRKDDLLEVLTVLHVESTVKGALLGRDIVYRHPELAAPDAAPGAWIGDLVPGGRVIAFLRSVDADLGASRQTFEAAYQLDVPPASDEERTAKLARLFALADVAREAERRGATDPAALLEWVVATIEEPLTREAEAMDLQDELNDVAAYAAKAGISTAEAARVLAAVLDDFRAEGGRLQGTPPPGLMGALLTAKQRSRLTAALLATGTLTRGDSDLFLLVRGWDKDAATAWLLQRLRTAGPAPSWEQLPVLLGLANRLDDDASADLARGAESRLQEIQESWPAEATSEDVQTLRQRALDDLLFGLRRDFAVMLAGRR